MEKTGKASYADADGLKQSIKSGTVQKAKEEADDYWTMCQWSSGIVPFGQRENLIPRRRWGDLPVKEDTAK